MYRFQKVDEGWYRVSWGGIEIGEIYRDPDAWSYAPWFIDGVKQEMVAGGVNQSVTKPRGYGTRRQAARALAMSQSAKILKGDLDNAPKNRHQRL